MVSLSLADFLSGHIYAFMLVLMRVGAIMALFPGIGEGFVYARARIMVALLITFVVFLPLAPFLPPQPAQIGVLVGYMAQEALIGFFFGAILRMLTAVIEVAGAIIAMQLGLSNAMILNPSLASQSALTSAFLSTTGLVLIFATGLDHMLFRAILDTYILMPPDKPLYLGDVAYSYARLVSDGFMVGVKLAAPFFFLGLLLYMILGFMQKLMPQVQLFLVTMPIQIWGGLFVLSASLTAIFTVWLRYFDATIGQFFAL